MGLIGTVVVAGAASSAGAPAAAAADPVSADIHITWTRPGVSGTLTPPAALRVGDEVTIQFEMSGFTAAGCSAYLSHIGANALMGIAQTEATVDGVGHCRPWTFIMPPAPAGQLVVDSSVHGDDPDGGEAALTPPDVMLTLQSGGTRRAYQSTYPTPSWASIDLFGTSTPMMDVPLVIPRPPGATRDCWYTLNGDMATVLSVRHLDYESCADWAVTLPDLRADAVSESPFGLPWEAVLSLHGGALDATTGAALEGFALTGLLHLEGSGGDVFSSNLPAIVFPEASHPRYALTGSTITIRPDVHGLDADGSCRVGYNGPITPPDGVEEIVPMTDGECASVSFVASQPGVYQIGTQLDVGGEPGPYSGYRVDVVEPMPPPELDVKTPVVGRPFDVASAVAGGVPSEFQISVAADGAAASLETTGVIAAGGTCARGYLDFFDDARTASAECVSDLAGSHRVTVRFQDVTGATRTRSRTITVLPFADIVGHKFALDIAWIAAEGITSGCGALAYCPEGLVTRAQMATFLARALRLPATSRDYFTDDEGNKHEGNINRLRAAGITLGCTATTFCPNGLVTRAQMATFLVRAFDLPATSRDYFTDDEGNKHEPRINALRASGITSGCSTTRFCPDGLVTRGQMAAFLHRAMR